MPSVQRVHWAKLKVAAVCATALLILGTLCVLLTGGTLLEPKSTIYLYMPDAVGVVAGAPVRVDGIGVGKVELVELSGSKEPDRVVKVTMTIERDRLRSIPEDSTAEASADTLVGDKFVDIDSGRSAAHIKPGGEILYKATPDVMKRLDVTQFEDRLRAMDALVSEIEQGKTPLGQFVQGDDMYRSLLHRVAELDSAIRTAARTTGSVGQALYGEAMYSRIADPLHELDLSLARIQSGQGPMGQLLRDNAQYSQLRDSMADLHKTVADLRGNAFLKSEQQYTDWNRSVQKMIRMVDDFASSAPMQTAASYDEFAGLARELESGLKDFRENPRKFLRLKMF
ncbi:MAG TPA: MlaD family protein [Candidatus Acidoferrales bacterium]|nr:MlaD family protein [Candidatus Acidoferrales bacterium]